MRAHAAARGFALLAAFVLAPLAAKAQGVHGLGQGDGGPRPLHLRVALADAAAIAGVETVELGRIRVRDAAVLFGALPAAFELKRAPSSAPALEPGDRVLLLLRGARPPYVLVDEPRELVRIGDAAAEARWGAAVRAMRGAAGDPVRLRDLYLEWVRSDAADARAAALRALLDLRAPLAPLPADVAVGLARSALDPAQPEAVREACAAVAARHPAGGDLLLAAVGASGAPLSAPVTEVALRGGVMRQVPAARAAVERALRDPDPAVRRAALRATPFVATPEVWSEVERIAAGDPDPKLREIASRVLASSRKRQP